MGYNRSKPLKCLNCDHKFTSSQDIIQHLKDLHQIQKISCPNCKLYGFEDFNHLVEHVLKNHDIPQDLGIPLTCPKCSKQGFKDAASLLEHNEQDHPSVSKVVSVKQYQMDALPQVESISQKRIASEGQDYSKELQSKALPRVGERVLAMWSLTPWQYFHATVRRFIPSELQFEIDWEDPDPSGRIVDYFNLAIDKSPNANEISIGSIVLFPQGEYVGGPHGGVYGGVRWHQGRITRIHDITGARQFDGCHTKGHADGKWITYDGYNYTFHGLRLQDLRIGPNVFDILDDNECTQDESEDLVDIYFSYVTADSPQAIKNREIQDVPQKYMSSLDKLCDPRDIAENLKKAGLKIGMRKASTSEELKQTATLIKQAKVFVACISDQYVANDECRMEFQYAKTTLHTPVVPLVVGDGSFEWTMSVVGMLIAGELYIHFKDKDVEDMKYHELLTTLKGHFGAIAGSTELPNGAPEESSTDIFLSYNWKNSFIAKEANQVSEMTGNKFTDPRLIKNEMEKAGFKVWLDTERLQSANVNAGMYEQLTGALKNAKVVVPCVSSEYANSPNCRMEFQFAVKTLQKTVIPLIVGKGDDWKTSVIGSLVTNGNNKPINLQDVTSHQSLMNCLKPLLDQLKRIMHTTTTSLPTGHKIKNRAPKVGDHVISHYMSYSYYTATVASFDLKTLQYTINWDDGDQDGRVQSYDQVALDIIPDPDDVAVGSIVLFPQGMYQDTYGTNTGEQMYHEGIVTACRFGGDSKLISGHHVKGENEGKWIAYSGYSYSFNDCPLENIRVPPSAMDAMLAAKS